MSEISRSLLSLVQPIVGKSLETRGRNDGPEIDKIRGSVSSYFADHAKGIPWCGMTVFWILRELSGLDRAALTRVLGYVGQFSPESCDSWLQHARSCPRPDGAILVTAPSPYDIFLWHRRRSDRSYDPDDAIHMGLIMPSSLVAPGHRYATLEGNTCPEGGGDGRESREGTCIAFRSRPYIAGGTSFIHVPQVLKDCF